MPDAQGFLTVSEEKQAKLWIDQHRKDRRCPVCSESNWQLATALLSQVAVNKGPHGYGYNLAGNLFPEILCICTTCGYTQHFLAQTMGLVSDGIPGPANPNVEVK